MGEPEASKTLPFPDAKPGAWALFRQAYREGDPRLLALKAIWAAAFLASFLLSPKLWVSSRSYPLTPVSFLLVPPPFPWDYLWFGTLLALLTALLVVPRPGRCLPAFVVLAGLLSLWDQSRWQPWFYLYLFLGALMCWLPWNRSPDRAGERTDVLNTCRLIIGSTYFWSGLQKLNRDFAYDIFPWMLQPFVDVTAAGELVAVAALVAAGTETVLGVALLVDRFRATAIIGVALMHAFIMLCIGPWGWNWNTVVWPWNLAMPLMTAVLFWRTERLGLAAVLRPRRLYHWVILLLFGVLPGLNLVGSWDAFLSASLYSGNTLFSGIWVRPALLHRLPEELQERFQPHVPGLYWLDVNQWSQDELNVPAYPARRIFKNAARQLRPYSQEPDDLLLGICKSYRSWGDSGEWTWYSGEELD